MTYVDPDLITDEGATAEGILAGLADVLGVDTQYFEGHLEAALAEAFGIVIATAVSRVVDEERNRFIGFGERILQLPRIGAGVADAAINITIDTTDGYLIEAGYQVVGTNPTQESVEFATYADVLIPAGQTTALNVPVTALDAGPQANGVSGPAVDDGDDAHVVSVTFSQVSANGTDEEDIDSYTNRAAERAQRLHAIPVAVDDYAAFSLDVAGVTRAIAVNLVDPSNPGEQPGHVTVYGLSDAALLSTGKKAELLAYLTATEKVIAATVHVADAEIVSVDVAAQIRRADDVTDSAAQAAVEAAIRAYLNPATYRYDDQAPGKWARSTAALTPFDISAAIDDLPEVKGVNTVTLNGATTPIAMSAVQLPNADDVTVTIA